MTTDKPVKRIAPTGEVAIFPSYSEAARQTPGGDKAHISRAIKYKYRHAGYKWEVIEVTILPHIRVLPSVLVLDVETMPMEVFVWGLYKQRISHDNIINDWRMLSWSGKWLFDSEMMSDVLTPREAVERDDKRIMESLYKVVDKADVIIAHNGQRFDIRRMNARLLGNGLKRPSPYQIIDTLKASQREFALSSHRLDYLGRFLTNKGKMDTDFELWKRCVRGESEALSYMEKYNREDVLLLEEVYMEIRGWIKSHPNLYLYSETDVAVCPTCMSDKLESCGDYVTPAGRFESLRCLTCGSISRMRKSKLTPKERDYLRVSVAR